MAVIDKLTINNTSGIFNFYDTTNKIIFSTFVNVPTSLVSGKGHNHDLLYMRTIEIDFNLNAEYEKLDILGNRIQSLAYKTDVLRNGGGTIKDNKLRNYTINTEVDSVINSTTSFNTAKGVGLSFQINGFFMNELKNFNKYDHFTLVTTSLNDTPFIVKAGLTDYAIQSKGYIFDGINNINELNIKLDTFTIKPTAAHKGNYRVGLSSFTYGFLKGPTASTTDILKKYSYSSGVFNNMITFNMNSDVTGLQKSNNVGYWLGSNNFKHNFKTDSVSQIFGTTQVDSNNSANDILGIIISGSSNVKTEKVQFSTDAFSVVTNSSIDTTQSSYIEI